MAAALGQPAPLNPGVDYTLPNYANSPLPVLQADGTVVPGSGMRKFVDALSLPGTDPTQTNEIGQFLPVAIPDTSTFTVANGYAQDSDYYEIAAVDYTEQMHSDLPPTRLRCYVQLETPANASMSEHYALKYPDGSAIINSQGQQIFALHKPHYLGPLIIAQRDRPTRIKYSDLLPIGPAGRLAIPVDTTLMGAGFGPLVTNGNYELYTENRTAVHLHGGVTPWISDGTPHQWITPAGEPTSYVKGPSAQNVPDMFFDPVTHQPVPPGTPGATNDPGPGSITIYYSNQQSGRLMFYHDHVVGITRLNVYAGLAAGYLIEDTIERALTPGMPEVPLVIEDKTFVPDAAQLAATDPLWQDPSIWHGDTPPGKGSLWFSHVYVPNQDPYSDTGANPMGRWDYGPWFWPVFPVDVPFPPTNSCTPESFMDTPTVNGTAYPYMDVQPTAYRFRILNACNDRMVDLQVVPGRRDQLHGLGCRRPSVGHRSSDGAGDARPGDSLPSGVVAAHPGYDT